MKEFNSKEYKNQKRFQLATGYISTTEIYFVIEKIIVKIEAEGKVEFLSSDKELVASVVLPKITEGHGTYNEVVCDVKNNKIILSFPIIEWIDNYPHCDGEYDRWDTKTVGYYTMEMNLLTNDVSMVNI